MTELVNLTRFGCKVLATTNSEPGLGLLVVPLCGAFIKAPQFYTDIHVGLQKQC